MRTTSLTLLAASMLTLFNNFPAFGEVDGTADQNLDEEEQRLKISEAFGHFIGRNLDTPGIHFDLESLISGIRAGAEGQPAPMSDEEYEQLMALYNARAYLELSNTNLDEANAFLESNGKKSQVTEIDKGKLQYEIIKEGAGETVSLKDNPLVHFKGALLDGTVFGSTEEAGTPIVISLAEALPGFQKGIVGMKEGEKRRLYFHPEYGEKLLENLSPNTLLIIDIEVLKRDASVETVEEGAQEAPLEDNTQRKSDNELQQEKVILDLNGEDILEEDFVLPQW